MKANAGKRIMIVIGFSSMSSHLILPGYLISSPERHDNIAMKLRGSSIVYKLESRTKRAYDLNHREKGKVPSFKRDSCLKYETKIATTV